MSNKIVDALGKIGQFLKEVRIELKKVSWSSREELKNSTIIVLVSITILAVVIGCFDFIMSKHTGQSIENIRKTQEVEHRFDSQEAVDWGIADRIITTENIYNLNAKVPTKTKKNRKAKKKVTKK